MESKSNLNIDQNRFTYRLFSAIADNAKLIIIVGALIAVGLGVFIPRINIDTSVEAFIDPDHSSLIYRNQVKETFGLSDPILLAVVNEEGIYNPSTLNLIASLTDSIQSIEGVDPDRITSLATENNIYGTEDGMIVEPFIEEYVSSEDQALIIKESVNAFPLYIGNLVSNDGTTSLLIVELLDKKKFGAQVYYKLIDLARQTERTMPGVKIHVAGEGAVVEHLGQYVQDDAKLMTPLAFLVITVILFLAYRTGRGVLLSNMVVLGSLLCALGIMVALNVPFYLVSNIIPVIIIAISVADSIHILGHYYETAAQHPTESSRNVTIYTMQEMWRPVLVTSITNVVGFIAMGYSSTMPPMQAVGLYSSLGVIFAWIFSIFVLPAVLVQLKLQRSKAFKAHAHGSNTVDTFGRIMASLGRFVIKQPTLIMLMAGVVVILGTYGIEKMELNDSMVEYFNKKEPIYKADELLNARMNGSNFFDVVIEADQVEGLFDVEHLKKIEKLEQFIESQPHVKGANSIIDILKQMNKSINENQEDMYVLPDDSELVAQYFLLYSASSDPTDLEQYVDYDYKLANLRVMMDKGQYRHIKDVLESTRAYIDSEFNDEGINAKVSGWLNVLYYWIGNIRLSHYLGVILTMIIVIAIASLSFKSIYAGLLAVVPVTVAVFLNYAIMGFSGIWLKVSTSITVAIAIGVAVDFAVHTIDRLLVLTREKNKTIDEALVAIYPSTGRSLLFNLLALALGFGVNMVSSVPPWATFGFLVMTMVSVSFLASLTLLPALIKMLQPRFLLPNPEIQGRDQSYIDDPDFTLQPEKVKINN